MGTVTADDFASGTIAAAVGGTTTVIDFAMQTDGSLLTGLETWKANARDKAHIDYGFHMAVTDASASAIKRWRTWSTRVSPRSKVFMAFKGSFMADDQQLLRVLGVQAKPVAWCRCTPRTATRSTSTSATRCPAAKRLRVCTPPPGPNPPSRRPPGGRFIWRRGQKRPVFVVHVSAASAVREIQEARMNGLPVFGETCVHYLTLTEEELHRPASTAPSMYARRRCGTSMTRMLWSALRQHDLQIVTTDHCPFNFCGQKELGRKTSRKYPMACRRSSTGCRCCMNTACAPAG